MTKREARIEALTWLIKLIDDSDLMGFPGISGENYLLVIDEINDLKRDLQDQQERLAWLNGLK